MSAEEISALVVFAFLAGAAFGLVIALAVVGSIK